MENLKINVPEGYEIDREKSTFEEIVFKKKAEKKWVDNVAAIITGYFISFTSTIEYISGYNRPMNDHIFPKKVQAQSALAYSRLAQIIEYDERFGGCITDEEWGNTKIKYAIVRRNDNIDTANLVCFYQFLAFHTPEQRDLFLQENIEWIRKYFML